MSSAEMYTNVPLGEEEEEFSKEDRAVRYASRTRSAIRIYTYHKPWSVYFRKYSRIIPES
jgi:hypothetical protein